MRRGAKGASGAELNQAIADADAFAKMYKNPLYRMPMTFIEMFPVGVLISLITAAILRNSRVLPARGGAMAPKVVVQGRQPSVAG